MAGLLLKYFVLKPRSKKAGDVFAIASRAALKRYADVVQKADPELATEIRQWVEAEGMRAVIHFSSTLEAERWPHAQEVCDPGSGEPQRGEGGGEDQQHDSDGGSGLHEPPVGEVGPVDRDQAERGSG